MSTSFISKENMLDISNGMYDYNENTYQHKNTLVDKVKEAIENGEMEVDEYNIEVQKKNEWEKKHCKEVSIDDDTER